MARKVFVQQKKSVIAVTGSNICWKIDEQYVLTYRKSQKAKDISFSTRNFVLLEELKPVELGVCVDGKFPNMNRLVKALVMRFLMKKKNEILYDLNACRIST